MSLPVCEKAFTEATDSTAVPPKLHAAIIAGVDKNGKTLFSKAFGRQTVASDGPPLKATAVMKIASCTKLITSIATLQLVERGLIGLDDSVFDILPELAKLEVVSSDDGGKTLTYTKADKPITPRQMLTHSSGLAYGGFTPLIMAHRKNKGLPEPGGYPTSGTVAECYSDPLVFQPGEGWAYSPGLDWAGQLVRRLNNNISLEEYFVENIFKPAGATAPFPTFDLSKHPEMKAELIECANRNLEGGLEPIDAPFGDMPKDEHGGSGLALTAQHYLAVIADILSLNSKLLKQDTIKEMFTPQLKHGSIAQQSLAGPWSMVYAPLTGGQTPIEDANYGLGGFVLPSGASEANIPKGTMMWWGYTSPMWQMNRERGIGGCLGLQHLPAGEQTFVEHAKIFYKEFWSTF